MRSEPRTPGNVISQYLHPLRASTTITRGPAPTPANAICPMNRLCFWFVLIACFCDSFSTFSQTPTRKPTVWMCPPGFDGGKHFAELFEKPDEWQQTRKAIDVLGYADLNFKKHFSDEQLQAWLPKLNEWGIKLGLEVGAIKAWGQNR